MLFQRSCRLPNSGYTIVEVMVTVAVATLGFIAIVDLQSSSLRGLANARNTTVAIHQAEHFIEMVRAETLQCSPALGTPDCDFLPNDTVGDAFRTYGTNADNALSPAGISPGDYDSGIVEEFPTTHQRQLCIQYRSTWVIPNRVMRLDTRVLWPEENTDLTNYFSCTTALIPSATSGQVPDLGMVTMSTTITVEMF